MKVNVKEFREKLRSMFLEDVDRLRRSKDGYGETEFEEDVDRLRRAKAGYGESEFEESVDINEATPPGFEKVVKGLKKSGNVDNPWAVANWMKSQGYKPHGKKESVEPVSFSEWMNGPKRDHSNTKPIGAIVELPSLACIVRGK